MYSCMLLNTVSVSLIHVSKSFVVDNSINFMEFSTTKVRAAENLEICIKDTDQILNLYLVKHCNVFPSKCLLILSMYNL